MINEIKDKAINVWHNHKSLCNLVSAAAFVIRSNSFLIKDLMPYEFSRSVKEKYSNGTCGSIRISRDVHWRYVILLILQTLSIQIN